MFSKDSLIFLYKTTKLKKSFTFQAKLIFNVAVKLLFLFGTDLRCENGYNKLGFLIKSLS